MSGADKGSIMADTGVHIMNWEGIGADPDKAAKTGDLNKTAVALDRQLQGMKDIILLGHSRGGKVIEWYLGAYSQRTATVQGAILVESPTSIPWEVAGTVAGLNTWPNPLFGQRTEAKIVTINNFLSPVGGLISGSENFQTLAVDGGFNIFKGETVVHGLKNYLAGPVFAYLRGEPTPQFGGPWPWVRFPVPVNPFWPW